IVAEIAASEVAVNVRIESTQHPLRGPHQHISSSEKTVRTPGAPAAIEIWVGRAGDHTQIASGWKCCAFRARDKPRGFGIDRDRRHRAGAPQNETKSNQQSSRSAHGDGSDPPYARWRRIHDSRRSRRLDRRRRAFPSELRAIRSRRKLNLDWMGRAVLGEI